MHLLKIRGGTVCGADGEATAEINAVSCKACHTAHDQYLEQQESVIAHRIAAAERLEAPAPVYRTFAESLEAAETGGPGPMLGLARTKQEALKVAIGAGVRGLKCGGEPKLLEYIGGRVWLLEDV